MEIWQAPERYVRRLRSFLSAQPAKQSNIYFGFVSSFTLSCSRSLRSMRRSFSKRLLELTCSSSFRSLKRTRRKASTRRDNFDASASAISPSISR